MKQSTRVVIGYVLMGLLGLADALSLANPTSGPAPTFINILDGTLGVLTLLGIGLALRGVRAGLPLAVVTRVLSALSSIPAFFAGVDASVVAIVIVGLVLTATAIALVSPRLTRSTRRTRSTVSV